MKKNLFLILVISIFNIYTYSQVVDTMKVINLNDIEITGIRPSSSTPISQKIIPQIEVEKNYNGQEMVYILDKTPSITSQSDGGHPNGYVSFRIRGIDQTRINMTLNGIPLNEPEDQGVYFSNYPNFAMNIKSMQIQRGVGTSSNGTSSYGGSINFEGKYGIEKAGSIGFSYGSFNTQTLYANYGTGLINNKFTIYGGISEYSSDGYRYNSGGNGYSGYLSASYFNNDNIIKITTFTGKSINKMAWLATSESDIKIDPRINYNSTDENDKFNQSFIQLQYIIKTNYNSTISSTIYYNRLDGLWGMYINNNDILNFGLHSNFFGSLTNYRLTLKDFKLNIGFNLNGYNREHTGHILTDNLYKNIGHKKDINGYIKGNYKLNNFTLFGDIQVRNTSFSYDGSIPMDNLNWTFLNPRFGGTYTISPKDNLYLSIGQSHREPTRTDMFGGNDDLISLNIIKPESVIDYELGYRFKDKKINLHTNLYYMDFKNEITLLGTLGVNGLPLMTSVDKSYRSGVEFELRYNITKNLSINNNTTYSYCRIIGDNNKYQPLYTPNFIVNQDIDYDNNGFNINLSSKYLSKSYIDPSNISITPSYIVFNLSTGYTYKNMSLNVKVTNILNKLYYTSGYVYNNENYYFIGTPQSFYTTIKYTF